MKNIRKLEAVQWRATKLILSFNNLTYFERLQKLNLPSLLYRQTRMDLIMTYKTLNNLVSVDKDYFFTVNTNSTHSNVTDSNSLKVILILLLEDIAFHSVLLMIGTPCHLKLYI